MSRTVNQSGLGHIGLILFVVAVAVIGFSAIEVLNANNKVAQSNNPATASSAKVQFASVPATITSKAGLQQASLALSDANSQMQSELNSSSLSSSINAML